MTSKFLLIISLLLSTATVMGGVTNLYTETAIPEQTQCSGSEQTHQAKPNANDDDAATTQTTPLLTFAVTAISPHTLAAAPDSRPANPYLIRAPPSPFWT